MDRTMTVSPVGVALVKECEGCRLDVYLDLKKKATVGWGHKLSPSEEHLYGAKISQKEADRLLAVDLERTVYGIKRFVYVNISQPQMDALVSLVFNIGLGHFASSTLLRALNSSDYHQAADQFLVWDKVDGEHCRALAQRRSKEHQLFLTGTA